MSSMLLLYVNICLNSTVTIFVFVLGLLQIQTLGLPFVDLFMCVFIYVCCTFGVVVL